MTEVTVGCDGRHNWKISTAFSVERLTLMNAEAQL